MFLNCVDFTFIAYRCWLWFVLHIIHNNQMIFILSLIVDLCSVKITLQGMSAMSAWCHHDILHCNNHSLINDSISSERQAFQVLSLHHREEESLQAYSNNNDGVKVKTLFVYLGRGWQCLLYVPTSSVFLAIRHRCLDWPVTSNIQLFSNLASIHTRSIEGFLYSG